MKLFLTQDVKNLGRKGDLVTVSDGYGRNFLLKRKLGSTTPIKIAKSINIQKLSADDLETLQSLRQAVVLQSKATDNGRLYAAVSPEDIQSALKAQYKLNIPQSMIAPVEPIKKTGEHQVVIKNNAGPLHTISVLINSLETK